MLPLAHTHTHARTHTHTLPLHPPSLYTRAHTHTHTHTRAHRLIAYASPDAVSANAFGGFVLLILIVLSGFAIIRGRAGAAVCRVCVCRGWE